MAVPKKKLNRQTASQIEIGCLPFRPSSPERPILLFRRRVSQGAGDTISCAWAVYSPAICIAEVTQLHFPAIL